MIQKRKTYSETFKACVAMEAPKACTLGELSATHDVHPTVIAQWKRQLVEGAPELFRRKPGQSIRRDEELTAPLYQEIGRLKMELDWLKKGVNVPLETRRRRIHPDPQSLSILQQCAVVGLARLTYYHERVSESPETLALMRLLDGLYLQQPFYGVPRMTDWLQTLGHRINHKRAQAGGPADAGHGPASDGAEGAYEPAAAGASYVSVSAAALKVGRTKSCLVWGHHVCAHASGVPVPGGDHELIQPRCGGVGGGQHRRHRGPAPKQAGKKGEGKTQSHWLNSGQNLSKEWGKAQISESAIPLVEENGLSSFLKRSKGIDYVSDKILLRI